MAPGAGRAEGATWLAVVVSTALLVALACAFGLDRSYMAKIKADQGDFLEDLARTIDYQAFERLRNAIGAMGQFEVIRRTAAGELGVDNPDSLLLLKAIRSDFDADHAFIMDEKGLAIACAPRPGVKSLTGNNYLFRPYFAEAMKGRLCVYPAVGVVTLQRGIFGSAPVREREGGPPIGAVAVKGGMSIIDQLLDNFQDGVAMLSPDGVVFASNKSDWLLRLAKGELSPEAMERIKKENQFAGSSLKAFPDSFNLSGDITSFEGRKYMVLKTPLDILSSDGRKWELASVHDYMRGYPYAVVCGGSVLAGVLAALLLLHIKSFLGSRASARDSERKFRAIIDQTFQFIGITTPDGILFDVNETALAFSGVDKKDVIDKPFWEGPWWAHSPELQGKLRDAVKRAASGEFIRFEATHPDSEGKLHCVDFSLKPIKDEGGSVIYLIPEGRDISEWKRMEEERKQLESQLSLSQKMEAIGQLAAGIAHEINTPIQYIGDNLSFLQDSIQSMSKYFDRVQAVQANPSAPSDLASEIQNASAEADLDFLREELPKALQQASEGVSRISEIVLAMKEFSHPGAKGKTPIDINKALTTTITVARNEWKYVADVKTELTPSLPAVTGMPGEINQVFLNLLVNAAHAIGDVVGNSGSKGTILVQTLLNGEMVEVRIKDSGTGIPEAIRNRIFEPFFTTKPVGKGTGQGLSLAHSIIVKKHGGQLFFESEEGKGSTFIIRLPVDAAKAKPEGIAE